MKLLNRLLPLFAFLLPWQTIWLYREPIVNGYKWEFGALGFYATEVLLWLSIALFVLWYIHRFSKRTVKQKFAFTKDRFFLLSVLVFVLYAFASSLWAPDAMLARQHALRLMQAILLFLMIYIVPISWKKMVLWFSGGMTIQALLGYWQFISQKTFASTLLGMAAHPVDAGGTSVIVGREVGRWLRAYGSFSHPNVFGGFLIISIFLTTFLWHENKDASPQHRIFAAAAMIMQITALFFTFSRSAWLSFVILWLILFLFSSKKDVLHGAESFLFRVSVYSALLIVLLTSLFMPLVQNRLFGDSSYEVRSVEDRLIGADEASRILVAHPFLGVGAGNYTAALMAQYPDREGWIYQPVHNVLLLFVAEFGFVGIMLCGLIVVAFIGMHEREYRFSVFVAFVVLLGLLGPLVAFDHYLYSAYSGLIVSALVVGVVMKYSTHDIHILSPH